MPHRARLAQQNGLAKWLKLKAEQAMPAPAPLSVIFDHDVLRLHLSRAARNPAAFLLQRCIDDALDRLAAIKRPLIKVLDVLTPLPVKGGFLPDAQLDHISFETLQAHSGGEILDAPSPPYDLALSLLGLQFINDLPGFMVQIRHALKPDGLFLAAMIGGQTLHELRTALNEAEAEISGGASPHVAPFADIRDMGGLLQRAGFALPVTDIDSVTVRYNDMFALIRDLRAMGATNTLTARSRTPLKQAVFLRAAQIYAQRFSDADGRVRATFEIIWLSGWVPDASQQKPLRPGSAKMRLAEALKVPDAKPE